jgi:hypothetical protein
MESGQTGGNCQGGAFPGVGRFQFRYRDIDHGGWRQYGTGVAVGEHKNIFGKGVTYWSDFSRAINHQLCSKAI